MLEALRQLRKSKGVTMKDVGAAIGVSEATVSLYERGLRSPSYEVLLKLGEYFDVSVDYLLNGADSPAISEMDDDSHSLAKAQQALVKAIEQNSDLPSKERICILFDVSDFDPMVIAFNLDFDQDYLTRWMMYGDIPPVPVIDKVLGVFQIKAKDLLDARDLEAYEDEQDETTVVIPAEASFTGSLGARVRATTRVRIDAALEQMTPEGQSRVADYAEDILLRYKAGEDPQNGGESAPAP